ncbi:MAG: LytR family transcriptional regulator, partial [Cyanobacteria bacterium KgW148]|nr:LytR family transcriptional regulator [Cyanobacteria bacterium KgW148]
SRYRGDINADIGRIKRQQLLLQAVQRKLSSPWTIARLKPLIDTIKSHIDTDLTVDEMIALTSFSLSTPPDRIETLTLPGTPTTEAGASYWITDSDTIDREISPKFNRQ